MTATYVTGRDIGQTERAMQQLLEAVITDTPLATVTERASLLASAVA